MAQDACNYTKYVVIVLVLIVAGIVITQCMKKSDSSEGFKMLDMSEDPSKTIGRPLFAGSQPDLKANLAPRSYDGLGQSLSGVPSHAFLPAQPVEMQTGAQVDFMTMGGGFGGAPDTPSGALTSAQAQDMLQQQMNGGKPELPAPALPLANIDYSTDPTNPENFMYDRSVFSKLKRQYGNQVDFIRGDIDVKQEYRGWFDVRPATDKDIVTGYFDRYIDIQQEASLKDSQFTRSTPVQNLFNSSISPANMQLTAYANV